MICDPQVSKLISELKQEVASLCLEVCRLENRVLDLETARVSGPAGIGSCSDSAFELVRELPDPSVAPSKPVANSQVQNSPH